MEDFDALENALNELSGLPRAQPADWLLPAIEERIAASKVVLLSPAQRWIWAVAATVLLSVNVWGLYQALGQTPAAQETLLLDYNLYES